VRGKRSKSIGEVAPYDFQHSPLTLTLSPKGRGDKMRLAIAMMNTSVYTGGVARNRACARNFRSLRAENEEYCFHKRCAEDPLWRAIRTTCVT
jgi:hypothetical protein